jgi:hypothetical protein
MKTFHEFVDKKTRRAKRQLKIIEGILRKGHMTVSSFLEEEDPYVFLKSNKGQTSFGGVRIYKIGNILAYRIQKEAKTHPYGKAYALDIEGMWEDLIGDRVTEEKAGHKIIEAIQKEFDTFLVKSMDAEKRLRVGDFDKKGDGLGNVMMTSSQGTDYSNLIHTKS